jgi:hypothetical protein
VNKEAGLVEVDPPGWVAVELGGQARDSAPVNIVTVAPPAMLDETVDQVNPGTIMGPGLGTAIKADSGAVITADMGTVIKADLEAVIGADTGTVIKADSEAVIKADSEAVIKADSEAVIGADLGTVIRAVSVTEELKTTADRGARPDTNEWL